MKTKKSQKLNNSQFRTGDLVYIPQDVQLWAMHDTGYNITKTCEPTTAVFLEERANTMLLFIKGQRLLAKKKHVYPFIDGSNNDGN